MTTPAEPLDDLDGWECEGQADLLDDLDEQDDPQDGHR